MGTCALLISRAGWRSCRPWLATRTQKEARAAGRGPSARASHPVPSPWLDTFLAEDKEVGLEPDECYYLANAQAALGMERFDAAIDPPPDLVVEVDGTRRVIPRLPIYAALGVPEVWRWSKGKLHILGLEHGQYTPLTRSRALPMIEPDALQIWVDRLATAENVSLVFRDFREWCRTLPR